MRFGPIPENPLEWVALRLNLAPTPFVDTFQTVVVARAVMVGTKLGVFSACAEAPQTSAEIAAKLDTDPTALGKLLNLLAAIGYLAFRDERYHLTPLARKWLAPNSRTSLHDSMMLRFLEWQAIEQTETYVRTGRALDVHELITGDQWITYQRGMRALARISSGEVGSRSQLPKRAKTMLDIGGGHGAYSVAFCQRNPALTATILDLPDAVAAAAPILAEEKMGERIVHRSGNALTEDLGTETYDVVFVSHLIHHFEEADNRALVGRIGAALRPGGVLIILDVMRSNPGVKLSQSGALLDLYFGVTSNSGTWSETEIESWFADAGLAARKPVHLRTAPGISLALARKL